MSLNKVSAVMDAGAVSAVITAIESIRERMPFLITLNEEEKASLPRFGDKSFAFVNKALELAPKIEESLPRNFSIEEMKKDITLYHQLYSIIQPMNILMEKLNDTYRELGAEAYLSALLVYNTAKQAGADTGGFDNVLDELGRRFSKKISKAPEVNPV